MSHYQELVYYDPQTDANAARVSMFNAHGHEFWYQISPIPAGGRLRREARERALDAIEQAISMGLQPGQVVIDG